MWLKNLPKETCFFEWKNGLLSSIACNSSPVCSLPVILYCIYKIQLKKKKHRQTHTHKSHQGWRERDRSQKINPRTLAHLLLVMQPDYMITYLCPWHLRVSILINEVPKYLKAELQNLSPALKELIPPGK